MTILRSILALAFAIFLANPTCCCAMMADSADKPASSCCGSEPEDNKAPHDCACLSHAPQIVDEPLSIPQAIDSTLSPPTGETICPAPIRPIRVSIAQPQEITDTGPPSIRRAHLQLYQL
jgi:hypothetical protein